MRAKAEKLENPPKLILPGNLQLAVLGTLWADSPLSYKRVGRGVAKRYKEVADSTISTTLTRLVQRGWVIRRGHVYLPGITREELSAELAQRIQEA